MAAAPAWWTSAVVYQIYPRSFADANGDGVGDLGGIRARLPYLRDLGVDVLWLSPIYRSPQADNGYDISDYQDIDPLFGTLDEFRLLLDEVHAAGMKLVMDLVVNHTSDEHPWFVESRSSRTNAKRDWYVWRDAVDGRPTGEREPNLWRSYFSGPAWDLDATTGQYYLHLFAAQQPDLNWENPEVRAAVFAMMRWWLDLGVDGFRMDVINFIAKLPEELSGDSVQRSPAPRVHAYLQEMRREVFADRDRDLITVGEMPGVTIDEAALFTDPARRELDMVFQFEHVDLDSAPESKFDTRPFALPALTGSLARWQQGLAAAGWNSLYLGNHDQPRAVSRFGDDGRYRYESATLLATVLHGHRGTPYVYQGEEIGMTNAGFTHIEQYRDIESLNWFAGAVADGARPDAALAALRMRSRDNARTPMQWSAGAAAGFTDGDPWIELPANAAEVSVEADEAAGERSVLAHYRRLIALRHEVPVLALGDFTPLAVGHPTLSAFLRTLDDDALLVVGNWSAEPLPLDAALDPALAPWLAAPETTLLLGNLPAPVGGPSAPLRPWEARILRRRIA